MAQGKLVLKEGNGLGCLEKAQFLNFPQIFWVKLFAVRVSREAKRYQEGFEYQGGFCVAGRCLARLVGQHPSHLDGLWAI